MAKLPILSILLLLLVSTTTTITTTAAATATAATSTGFIVEKCSATRYAALCVQSLSAYASKIQRNQQLLAQTALSVSLQRAQSAKAFVDRLSRVKGLGHWETAAIQDCVEVIGDTVDRLGKSAQELQRASPTRPEDFRWHMSNVQTWVSAALTDDNTCMDGFDRGRAANGKVKSAVNSQINNVVHYTSVALALINQYASKH